MIRFLSYLFSLYAAIVFVITLLLVFPVYVLFFLLYPSNADRKAYPVTRFWGKILAILYLVRLVKIYNFRPSSKKQYIYIANHRSMLDIPFTAVLIPGHFRFLAKSSLLKIPLLGMIIKGICITVDRKSLLDKNKSYQKMKETLQSGSSVLVYPEGTRNVQGTDLNPLQNGAFRLSAETGVPIVVLTLWSTSRVLSKDYLWRMRPVRVYCYIDGPVEPQGKHPSEIQEECKSIFLNNIQKAKNLISQRNRRCGLKNQ